MLITRGGGGVFIEKDGRAHFVSLGVVCLLGVLAWPLRRYKLHRSLHYELVGGAAAAGLGCVTL